MGMTLPVQPPARAERLGGIRAVAEFRENGRLGPAEALVFQSDGCALPNTEKNRCIADTTVPDKTADGIDNLNGIGEPFTIYAAVACWAAGPDDDELQRAEAALEAGKDRTLEEVFGVWAQAGTPLAGATDFVGAIAELEQELDSKYLGRGIISMSRADAVRAKAAGAIEDAGDDGSLKTVNGTPILASGMIESGTVSATGAIVVEHTSVNSYDVLDPQANQHYALAEQMHALVVDCEFRVTVTVA